MCKDKIKFANDELISYIFSSSAFVLYFFVGSYILLIAQSQVRNAGNYALKTGKETLKGISFNYNRAESQMEFYSPAELNDFLTSQGLSNVNVLENSEKPLVKSLMEATLGIRLWRWFVLLALLSLLTESLLLRFWK